MSKKNIIKKEYKNNEVVVIWQPHLCIHSKKCWKGLLSVFDPRRKPWIDMNGTSSAEIVRQVK